MTEPIYDAAASASYLPALALDPRIGASIALGVLSGCMGGCWRVCHPSFWGADTPFPKSTGGLIDGCTPADGTQLKFLVESKLGWLV